MRNASRGGNEFLAEGGLIAFEGVQEHGVRA
jgi:hypothetical protein